MTRGYFREGDASRIAKATRRLERTPINGGDPYTPRRIQSGVKQIKHAQVLSDDFEEEVQDGETVNVRLVGSDKYLYVSTGWAEGLYFENMGIMIGKIDNSWHVISEGYTGCYFTMTSAMSSNTGSADLYLTQGGEGSSLNRSVRAPERLTKLKEGHSGWCYWTGNHWQITNIENEIIYGQFGSELGDPSYPALNQLGWDILDGAGVVGFFIDGKYLLIGAACS